jgi:ribosomal-protein-alanine N-acetyltransferase
MPNIRLAEERDLDYIYKLETECFEKAWTRKTIETCIKDLNTKIYLLEEDEKILAYIIYSKIIDEINLDRIGVAKNYRKRAYASLLIEKMLEEKLNTSLEVSEKNLSAIKLYEKYNFKTEGRRKDYYKIGEDALIMWRKI